MAGRLVAGMDLGSTGMKLLVLDEDGVELVVEEVPTPWRAGQGGTADLPPERLVAAVEQLLATAARRLATITDDPVVALAIAGMGETGMVVDAGGRPVAPAFAWFDPRGAEAGGRLPRRDPRRVRRAHRPPARAAGVRRQARLPAGAGPGAGRPALAEPAEFVVTTLGGRAGARDVPRLPHRAARPGLRRTVARDARRTGRHRGLPAAPRHGGRGPRPDRRWASLRGRPAHGRGPRPPRRGRGRRPDPDRRATTSRWARPRCCSG